MRVLLLWLLPPVFCFHGLAQTPPLKPDGFAVLVLECDPIGGDRSAKPSIFLRDPTPLPQGDARGSTAHYVHFLLPPQNGGPKKKKLHFFSFTFSELCMPPPDALTHQRKQFLRICDILEENVAVSSPFGVGMWRSKPNKILTTRAPPFVFHHVRSLF